MNPIGWMESAWGDLRHGARLLRLNRGFFAVSALSLALGVGANTALFQLVDAIQWRLLPVPRPEQLAELKIAPNDHCCSGNFADRRPNFTGPQWQEIRRRQQVFSSVFAWGDHRFNLAQAGEVRPAEGLWVSGDFFRTLGLEPVLGRLLNADDDRPGCGVAGVVISYPFWQREFAGSPKAVGSSISLDGHRATVIGVTPAEFFGVEVGRSFDVAAPICAEPAIEGEGSHLAKRHHWWLAIMGRMKPGVTAQRAAAQIQTISRGVFENTVPEAYRPDQAKYYAQYKLTAENAGSGVSGLRREYDDALYLLLAISGLVLLIACANLANLMLARATSREREIAVRTAIGASRGRLIRQLLAENLLLALAGAACGAMLAQFLSRYLVGFISTGSNPLALHLTFDWRVLGFTAAVAVLTCVLFGLAPALQASRANPSSAMKASSRSLTTRTERFGLRRILVVSQVALSLVLLVAALLFTGSLRRLLTLNAGFRENGVLITGIDASQTGFTPERRGLLYKDLLARVRSAHGIESASTANIVQVSGSGWNEFIDIPGRHGGDKPIPWFNRVGTDYFKTMGTPLIAGRDFDERDTVSSPAVAIVNRKFAAKFLGGANPVGRQFRIVGRPGEAQPIYQIVGLVADSKYQSMRDDFVPVVFVAQMQDREPGTGLSVIVRSSLPLGSVMGELRRTILGVNGGLSMDFRVFHTQIRESLLRERMIAALSGFFGVLALVLAAVGLYGVISYGVTRRRGEIGIRIALGSSRNRVVRLVLRESFVLVLIGVAAGSALALAAARTAKSLVYGIQATDPAVMELAVALLIAIAAAACFVPALRAARLEPMAALREE
jgi:predicted permease